MLYPYNMQHFLEEILVMSTLMEAPADLTVKASYIKAYVPVVVALMTSPSSLLMHGRR